MLLLNTLKTSAKLVYTKNMRVLLNSFLFLFLFLLIAFVNPNYITAVDYGTYGCFSSGSSGGCHPRLEDDCTNGGLVPSSTQCDGLLAAECHSASFACNPPGSCASTGQACSTAADCCLMNNCIDSICQSSGGGSTGGGGTGGAELCSGGKGIDTAIGCIPIQSGDKIAGFFLKWGIGVGGGIALIMISISSFMIMTSSGDPHRLQAGKELLTSALSGLILLIFSAFILNTIGLDILGIF